MRYQQLGGYYGGATISLDAARVMANVVPLRKLIITGRKPKKSLWLKSELLQAALDAGRWHWADYSAFTDEGLVEALDCWSPGAREWIAEELGRRGTAIPQLLEALESKSGDKRAGACAALGYHREKAAGAVDALMEASISKVIHGKIKTPEEAGAAMMTAMGSISVPPVMYLFAAFIKKLKT